MKHVFLSLVLLLSMVSGASAQGFFGPPAITQPPKTSIPVAGSFNPNFYVVEDDIAMCRSFEVAEAKARTLAGYWDNAVGEARVQAYLTDLTSARKAVCAHNWAGMEQSLKNLYNTELAMVYQFGRTRGMPLSALADARKVFYSLSNAVLTSVARMCGGGTYQKGLVEYIFDRSSKPIDFMGRPNLNTSAKGVASMSLESKYDGDLPRAEFCPPTPIKIPDGAPGGRSPTPPPSSRNTLAAFNAIPPSSNGCYQETGAGRDCSPIAEGPEAPETGGGEEPPEKEKEKEIVVGVTTDDANYTMTAGPVSVKVNNAVPNAGASPTISPETKASLEKVGALIGGIYSYAKNLSRGGAFGYTGAVIAAVGVMAIVVLNIDDFCNATECGFVYAPGTYMCPLFRAGAALDPVFIRAPSGNVLTTGDAFETCACKAGTNLGHCTEADLTKNSCYFDPLISTGSSTAIVSDICVDAVYTDNPWLNKPDIRDGYCYVMDCPPGEEPGASAAGCGCAGVGANGPALPANWDICLAAMCPIGGEGCQCM
jgi:hypothetical protein